MLDFYYDIVCFYGLFNNLWLVGEGVCSHFAGSRLF